MQITVTDLSALRMIGNYAPYLVYKPSSIEWIGDVPEHWEVHRLQVLADMRVSNVDKHAKEGEFPVRLCSYI